MLLLIYVIQYTLFVDLRGFTSPHRHHLLASTRKPIAPERNSSSTDRASHFFFFYDKVNTDRARSQPHTYIIRINNMLRPMNSLFIVCRFIVTHRLLVVTVLLLLLLLLLFIAFAISHKSYYFDFFFFLHNFFPRLKSTSGFDNDEYTDHNVFQRNEFKHSCFFF